MMSRKSPLLLVASIVVLVLCTLMESSAAASIDYAASSLRALADKESQREEVAAISNKDLVQFYGKLFNTCDAAAGTNCFSAVVASGRTTFTENGGDLANIYVPANDYDTWRQHSDVSLSGHAQTEGEFVYQLQNDTLSCLTVQLSWAFQRAESLEGTPLVSCEATSLAANWDCHLDWAVTAECAYNPTTLQVESYYHVVNLGPERKPGEPSVLVVNNSPDNIGGGTVAHLQRQVKKGEAETKASL